MNNTFCLGIFLALVYARGLEWNFHSETISILVIELLIGFLALKCTTQRVWVGCAVLLLLPLSLVLVAILQGTAFKGYEN